MTERDTKASQGLSLFNTLPSSLPEPARSDTANPMEPGREQFKECNRSGTPLEGPLPQRSDEAWLGQMTARGVPPLIARAQIQFRRDLPELIGSHAGDWVAYSGEERIGVGPSEKELVLRCVRQGLRDDQFVVRAITPEVEEIIDPMEWSYI
jgi:hypothetical protein